MTEPQVELDHEFSLDIDFNTNRWLELPPRWDTEDWQDIDFWARDHAQLFWRFYGQDPGESGISFLAGTLRRLAESFSPEPFDTRVLLRMWEPTAMPLPLLGRTRGPAPGPARPRRRPGARSVSSRVMPGALMRARRCGQWTATDDTAQIIRAAQASKTGTQVSCV